MLHSSYPPSLLRSAVALLSVLLLASSCQRYEPTPDRLNVYAASSLTDAFTEIKRAFEEVHDDLDIALTFAGSQVLRLQIGHGAPADLFASANPDHAQALAEAGLLHAPRVFAVNELVVIVPRDNPSGIYSYSDITNAVRLVIGTDSVPIGRYTRVALRRAEPRLGENFAATVLSRVASLENNVRLVRAKVELGEADAGIVYRTDAVASAHVHTIPISAELNVRAKYIIGVVTAGTPADRFISFLLSPQGQAILSKHGFLDP